MQTPRKIPRHLAHAMLMMVALIWGLTFISQTTGGDAIGPFAFVVFRFIIGALTLLPLALMESRRIKLTRSLKSTRDGKKVFRAVLALSLTMAIGTMLQQISLGHTSVANAAFLTVLYVPLVPICALIIFRKSISATRWGAVAVFLIGAIMMTGVSPAEAVFGDSIVAVSALFWAFHIMLVGWLARRTLAPMQLAFVQTVFTALIAAPIMLAVAPVHMAQVISVLPELLFAGVLSTGLGFGIQIIAQRSASNTAAAIIFSLESVFAAIAGWLLLGQSMAGLAIIGAAVILMAVLIIELTPADTSRL